MDEFKKPAFMMRALYGDVLMIATTDELPNFMLVLFSYKNEAKMRRAMSDFEKCYSTSLDEDHVENGLKTAIGFWMPTKMKNIADEGNILLPAEAIWLQQLALAGTIVSMPHTKTCAELNREINHNLARAHIAKDGWLLN